MVNFCVIMNFCGLNLCKLLMRIINGYGEAEINNSLSISLTNYCEIVVGVIGIPHTSDFIERGRYAMYVTHTKFRFALALIRKFVCYIWVVNKYKRKTMVFANMLTCIGEEQK